jgi:hypothetical protein
MNKLLAWTTVTLSLLLVVATGCGITGPDQSDSVNVVFSESPKNPAGAMLATESDEVSDQYCVFAFNTRVKGGSVRFRDLKVAASASAPIADLVSDAQLLFAGSEYPLDRIDTVGADTTGLLVFDMSGKGKKTVSSGESVAARVCIRFNPAVDYPSEEIVQVRVSPTAVAKTKIVNAADSSPIADSKKTGSATGATHTLRQPGLYTKTVSTDAYEPERGEAIYEVTLDMEAFATSVYVRNSSYRSDGPVANEAQDGFSYTIDDPDGVTSFGEAEATIQAPEATVYQGSGSSALYVPSRESRMVTFRVNFRLEESADYYRLHLWSLQWATTEAAVDANRWRSLAAQKAETDYAVLP